MGKYLSYASYFLLDDSVPGASSISVAVFNRLIARAESLIDTYCGFDSRYGGFEPHKAYYQTDWDEKTLRIRVPNAPVPVRAIDRYRIQVSNTTGGDGFFATISANDTVINVTGGYVEIVPLQAITYSMTPFMYGLGLRPPLVGIDYETGFYFPVFADALDNPSADNKTFASTRGFWAQTYSLATYIQPLVTPVLTPNVYVNGALQASNTYAVDYTNGIITFNAAQASGVSVTADYTYVIPDAVRDATAAQVTWMLNQRNLTQMGLGGIEVARSRDQQIKRHIRTSSDASSKDEPAVCPEAMQLLEPYLNIPIG